LARRISDIIPKIDDDGQRGARRFRLNADIEFVSPANTSGIALEASHEGMRVLVDAPLAVGTRCIAVVQLQSGEKVHERAEVMWLRRSRRGWIAGLSFAS
jgi:hypothetical protein